MLDSQIYVYSVDTRYFYSNHEKYLHDRNYQYRKECDNIDAHLSETEKNRILSHKKKKAKQSKEQLITLLSHKVDQNEMTGGKDHIRCIREQDLHDNNRVAIFESSLTRTVGISKDEQTDALFIVQVYYFDIFKDICFYGFLYQGEKYRYFTSSAGQIRTKKAIFIKESVWNRIEKTMMCGLTIDRINAKGGNNVNKHLAYMALVNSATDEWKDFDIDRCIVVDDFETNVYGTFDFIDETDYSITRKTDFVPITHTDGAGMMLPSVMIKNTMFRAPWIKGLLGVFDFRKFIEMHDCSPIITDIYGQEHDVDAENIQIIFTKSQFKMYKYYDSWDEYKDCFKRYHCQAGRCNIEEDRIKNAKINYQMLQTLTDITDDEIDLLTAKSIEKITNICQSEDTMKNILGITPYNTNMTSFQKAVKIYPALLNDTYTKDLLREIKDSLLKKYRSGKLEINGKYMFILPDYYAACEHWFGCLDTPKGLLGDGEVFCRLYKNHDKLDCLRSPHLYKEHAIRKNTANKIYKERADKIKEWFITDAVYTSTYDLISKMLQFDVDGDKSLVVAEPDFVRIAERNMKGVVPLYYNMRKAEPMKLNQKNIYSGLTAAFTGGNIGVYSNHISKIWNSDVFISGTEAEKQHAVDCVKRLCCQNNFIIDFAKTLYKPEFPKEIADQIKAFTGHKLPAFFEYAKDKEQSQLEKRNHSFVNQIFERILDKPINTRGLKLDELEYPKLMKRGNIVCPKEVSDLYNRLNKEYHYKINMKDEYSDNFHYVACDVRAEFSKTGYSDEMIADMLVHYLYGKKKRSKQLLWFCYGQYLVHNLQKNVKVNKTKDIQCVDCGEWFEVNSKAVRICRCTSCLALHKKELARIRQKRRRKQ